MGRGKANEQCIDVCRPACLAIRNLICIAIEM